MIPLAVFLAIGAAPDGQIAFVSGTEQANRRVLVLDIDSRSLTQAGPGSHDGAPRWSPDGNWLAFESRSEAGLGIYVVQADGSKGRFLSHAQAWNRAPAWSVDGGKLAYSAGEGLERQIVVCDLETDRETVWGAGRVGLLRPVWLSDPAIVAILASQDGFDTPPSAKLFEEAPLEEGILAIGLTGKPRRLSTDIFVVTPSEAFAIPDWALPSKGNYAEWAVAPHMKARSVAFESNDGGDREIFVLTARGAYDVSNHRAADWNPVWAPGGKWIAFESLRGGTRGIYRVHRDTNRVFPVAVTENADNWAPAWSPDGEWIAHVSDREGGADLFITEYRGKTSVRLTEAPAQDLAPAWRPVKP